MPKKQPDSSWFFAGLVISLGLTILLFARARALSFIPIIGGIYCFYYILSDRMIRKGTKYIEDRYGSK